MPSVAVQNTQIVLQKRRWFILFVLAGLNISNGSLWISFAPISNFAASYYDVSSDDVNWLSMVFFVAAIPFGIIATIVVDKFGLKPAMHIGAILNALGGAVRILSTAGFMPAHLQFPLTMTGQVLAAIAQPFIMFIPTKFSEEWFPDNQRTISTSIAALSNPIGISLGSLLSPVMVSKPEHMPYLNVVWGSIAIIFGPLALFIVRSSSPSQPPSTSALEPKTPQPYLTALKQLFTNKQYLILFLVLGGGIGAFSCFITMIQQMLCPKGYSNNFSGICGALISFVGIIGAGIAGTITDKTKKFEEVAKFSFGFAALASIAVGVSFHWSYTDWLQYIIGFSCALFGLFVFGAYPVCLELGVECTYPLDEAISSGFIIISGQIQGVIYIVLLSSIGAPLSEEDKAIETCTVGTNSGDIKLQDMSVPALVFAGIMVGLMIIFVLFFKANYKRMEMENLHITRDILASGEHNRISHITPQSYS